MPLPTGRKAFRHSVKPFVLRSLRNPLTLNQTGLITVTVTPKALLFLCVIPACWQALSRAGSRQANGKQGLKPSTTQ